MRKLMMVAAVAALACGCVSTHKNDGGDANLQIPVVKDVVHEKYDVASSPVAATESLNVLFGLIVWGKTATHYADDAPFRFFDKIGEAKNGAYANACDQANCDSIVGAHYKVRIEDYFVFKKLTCEINGYPASLKGVELIENKSLPGCCCGKK